MKKQGVSRHGLTPFFCSTVSNDNWFPPIESAKMKNEQHELC